MKKITIILFFIIGIIILTSFSLIFFWSSQRPSQPSKWGYYTEAGIYNATEDVKIGNIALSLETYIWRDFMPITPPDGKPLTVIIKIHAQNVSEFPTTLSIERIWIINKLSINSTLATNEFRIYNNTYEMVFRDGPKWGPGIKIDVVVKLKYYDLSFYYLKASNQTIYRTD
ncbi:MAG: hypothetical protein P8Y70_11050 [Candidatus Lokiarchaeota archaeon]